MKLVWGDDHDGYLDYVTGWHALSMKLLHDRPGEFSYVTTNSITQGQPVPALFGPLQRNGWHIKYAHRTFAWDSEAPGKAAVHCVIVGFTKDRPAKAQLWDYETPRAGPHEIPVETGINAYLVDGPRVLVKKANKPLSSAIPPITRGAQPTDGGHLTFKAKEGTRGFDRDPIASKYLRRFVGATELINNTERWCLWFVELTSADRRASKNIQQAIEASYEWRSKQKPSGDAYKLKDIPHLFRPSPYTPTGPYLCIPIHVPENRRYWTPVRFGSEVISSNANFIAPDDDGLLFALISSSMFLTWQRTIGGRIKSDYRLSSTVTWNTFPAPALAEEARNRIIAAGRKVHEAREQSAENSVADLYDPYLMGANRLLQRAHDNLDREIDKAFGASRKLSTEEQRLEILFARYAELTSSR